VERAGIGSIMRRVRDQVDLRAGVNVYDSRYVPRRGRMKEPPDGVRFIRRELHDDGTVMDTAYFEAPLPDASDTFVRTRLAPEGGSEIITEFAPASARPASYPAALPFLPDRAVWTTESPSGRNLEGARWFDADVETLLSNVVDASCADGWIVIPLPPRARLLGSPDVVLQREDVYRELQIVRIDDTGLLQLWDVPVGWFDARQSE
jgi:hypothetical protein